MLYRALFEVVCLDYGYDLIVSNVGFYLRVDNVE